MEQASNIQKLVSVISETDLYFKKQAQKQPLPTSRSFYLAYNQVQRQASVELFLSEFEVSSIQQSLIVESGVRMRQDEIFRTASAKFQTFIVSSKKNRRN